MSERKVDGPARLSWKLDAYLGIGVIVVGLSLAALPPLFLGGAASHWWGFL